MRHKIALIVFLVFLLFISACISEQTPMSSFTFMNDITWASTPDDIEAVISQYTMRREDVIDGYDGFFLITYDNTACFEVECDKICFLFFDNKLIALSCYFSESKDVILNDLIDNMSKIYGAADIIETESRRLSELLTNTKIVCEWYISNDTDIKLFIPDNQWLFNESNNGSSYEQIYSIIIGIENFPRTFDFETAVLEQLTSQYYEDKN